LLEGDEKWSFDVGVQLKFGNYQTLVSTLRDQATLLIRDCPVEIFKTRWEVVESLIGLVQHQEINVCFYANLTLQKLVKSVFQRVRLV
jgi:hypothetical protein